MIAKIRKIALKNGKWIFIGFCCILLVIGLMVFFLWNGIKGDKAKSMVTIAVLQNDMVQNFNTNYYTRWLEAQTGYDIQFEYISDGYEREYLYTMLTSNSNNIDAVFLPQNEEILSVDELNVYGEDGLILDLSDYISESDNLNQIVNKYKAYGLCDFMENNEAIYYVPNMDTARKSQNMQMLWINVSWLQQLGLQIPKTTDDLIKVLKDFRENDPNGNGRKDELPLISCEASYSTQSYNYLLNAFIYNDPLNGRMYIDEQGITRYASTEDSFRKGLIFCKELYEQKLISDNCFSYTPKQTKELVNDPADLVGAFTSKSIADVIYPNCPDILAKFMQIPPLLGPEGQQNAVWVNFEPEIGGYIPANSKHQKEALRIMDIMLSEEASLISKFGEEGVNWKYSNSGDLSTYGSKAKITTINYINDIAQNINYAGAGPQVLDTSLSNGVTWNGNHSLVEYLDARAVLVYEKYYGTIKDKDITLSINEEDGYYKELCAYTDDMILSFITGQDDVLDDEVWQQFLVKHKELVEKMNLDMRNNE